jgi:hypothetical protein
LNDYFGELCWDRDYEQSTLMEIDSITIKIPQFSITQVKNALFKIRKTETGPDEILVYIIYQKSRIQKTIGNLLV